MSGKTVAIIPARGGSKRVPHKNKKIFNGKPLIEWTIDTACQSELVDYIVVSSDDEQILEIAAKFNKVICVKRPVELATDTASINDGVRHAINELLSLNVEVEHLILLQPPCPLKTTEDVNNAIALYHQGKYGSVVSVTEVEHPIDYSMTLDDKEILDDFYGHLKNIPARSQDCGKEYRLNGVIYITSIASFMANNTVFNAPGRAFIMPRSRSVDIDLPIDFAIAEALAQYKEEA